MTKIGWIRLDIFDCTEEHEKLFRVHGIDDIMDTSNPLEAAQFLMSQTRTLLEEAFRLASNDNSEA